MNKKRFAILIFAICLLIGVSTVLIFQNKNEKIERGESLPFNEEEIESDLSYLLNNSYTLTNRVIADFEIENFKKSDTVYIIENPKKLNIEIDRKFKKIVVIKTPQSIAAVLYSRAGQEVRMKNTEPAE